MEAKNSLKISNTMTSHWQIIRSRLNHDILCNQLRNELTVLRRHPIGSSYIRLELWLTHADEYRKLFNSASSELSPQKLVDLPAFDCWTAEEKKYFGSVFHQIFLITSDIEHRISDLKQLLEECVESIEKFLNIPRNNRTENAVNRLQDKLELFSTKISELPSPYAMD